MKRANARVRLTTEEARMVNQLNMLIDELSMNAAEAARMLGIRPEDIHERFRPLVGRLRSPTANEQERISIAAKIFHDINSEFSKQRRFDMRKWLMETRWERTLWEMLQSGSLSDLYLIKEQLPRILSARSEQQKPA